MNKSILGGMGLLLMLALPVKASIQNLFISEYVQGIGNNKAIELYNGKSHAIDLSDYALRFYLNGARVPSYSVPLEGYLTPNTTFVVANRLAASEIRIVTDQAADDVWFDSDDVVVLTYKNRIIDSFGQVGHQAVKSPETPGFQTKFRTMRRMPAVASADINIHDPIDHSRQWKGFALNNFDGLGSFITPAQACLHAETLPWFCTP